VAVGGDGDARWRRDMPSARVFTAINGRPARPRRTCGVWQWSLLELTTTSQTALSKGALSMLDSGTLVQDSGFRGGCLSFGGV